MHMFEIYRNILRTLKQMVDWTNFNMSGRTKKDFAKLAQTLHFGREGKLYFPEVGSSESVLIEEKLVKYGIIQRASPRANLQVWWASTYLCKYVVTASESLKSFSEVTK